MLMLYETEEQEDTTISSIAQLVLNCAQFRKSFENLLVKYNKNKLEIMSIESAKLSVSGYRKQFKVRDQCINH